MDDLDEEAGFVLAETDAPYEHADPNSNVDTTPKKTVLIRG